MIKNRFTAPTYPDGPGKNKNDILSIIILAAQAGYRMKSYGPTSLYTDKYGRTILQNQAEILKQVFPNSEIILVGGFEIDKIIKNKPNCVRVVENQLFETTNEVEECRLGLNNCLSNNVLITYGDIYFNLALARDLQNKESTLVLDSKESMLADDVGATMVDDYVTIFSFAIPKPKWAKIVYLTGKELLLLKQFVNDRNNAKMYLFEALNYILSKNGQFKSFKTSYSHEVIHLDNSKELEKIK